MSSTTICMLVCRDFATEVHSFESLGCVRTEVESEYITESGQKEYAYYIGNQRVKLAIACFDGVEQKTKEYFKTAGDIFHIYGSDASKPAIHNELIKETDTDYVCFVSANTFVKKYWIEELVFYANSIAKAGAVGISSNLKGCSYLPILSDDDENSVNVFIPKINAIDENTIWITNRQNFYFVGAFNSDTNIKGLEMTEWQLRAYYIGLTNFYIPTQSCFQAFKEPIIFDEIPESLDKNMKAMRKAKNFYLPL